MSAEHLLAQVRAERYAIPVEHLCEVAAAVEPAPVPGAPAAVLGVMNVRGDVLPVVDLGAVLGLAAGDPGAVAVVEHAGRRAALAVDELVDVLPLTASTTDAEPPLTGSVLLDGRLTGIVDVAAVLDAVAEGARR